MSGTVLVTGGSGFVGGAIVRALVAQGREVVGLARSHDALTVVERLGARPVRGDVLDPASLDAAARGCRSIFHAAGVNVPCPLDPSAMFRANVGGTANVVRAAARAGVARVVHTSSAATIGEPRGTVGREDAVHRRWFLTAYERSKFEAERAALALGTELGVEVVSVNPASVQGPGRADGTARLLAAAARGRLPFAVDTWISLVDVDDCAEGHLLAEERGRAGARYLLSAGSLRTREAILLLQRITGRRRRTIFLPGFALVAAAAAVELTSRAARREPPVCRELARAGLHGRRYDGSLASRELGLAYRPLEETVRRTLAWLDAERRTR